MARFSRLRLAFAIAVGGLREAREVARDGPQDVGRPVPMDCGR